MAFKFFNYIALQIMWLLCVSLGSKGYLLWPSVCFALFLILHFLLSPYKKSDLFLCVLAVLGGVFFDTLWSYSGLIRYGENTIHPIAPIWIVYLWAAFALTLNHSMAWLKKNYILAIVFSALSGPITFFAASKVGDIEFIKLPTASILLAITWGIFVPALCYLGNINTSSIKVATHASD